MSDTPMWRHPCMDCLQPTWRTGLPSEWYMVHDYIWAEAGAPTRDVMTREPGHYLCIACLERRLGRQLTAADFPPYPVNQPSTRNTNRLNDRLTAT